MSLVRLIEIRCDVVDKYNPSGCPVIDHFRSVDDAYGEGWSKVHEGHACPGHTPGG